ncbi:MAG TPA: hypothetical protein PLR25_10535 [Planctomycetaceae bacterium]|nr:hypothetical protein [Planctomycetaceae bacterium]
MKRLTTQLLTTLLVTLVCSASYSQLLHRANRPIEIDEVLWLQLSDEPQHHMYDADRDFREGNRAGAVQNIRKTIVFLRVDAANASDSARNGLEVAADDLQSMAHRLENGTEVRAVDLESAFSRVQHAIAENHCACAKESWGHKRIQQAGYRMRAAGAAIERSAKWSGTELDAGVQASVEDARRVGATMVEDKDYAVDEIGKGLTSLGNGIASLGHRIERK